MKLKFLYEAKPQKWDNPKDIGGKESEAEGRVSKTVKRRPAFGASQGPYKGPRSA